MASEKTSGHLDSLALDLIRTDEESPQDRLHLESCVQCREALAELEALASELRRGFLKPVEIPAEIDQRILWNARKGAREMRRSRSRRVSLRSGWAVAAAAVLALSVAGLWRQGILLPASAPPQRIARADIDGDGTVDMVDALRLARAIKRGEALDPGWDVNGDGRVDGGDTDAVAMRAVAIRGA